VDYIDRFQRLIARVRLCDGSHSFRRKIARVIAIRACIAKPTSRPSRAYRRIRSECLGRFLRWDQVVRPAFTTTTGPSGMNLRGHISRIGRRSRPSDRRIYSKHNRLSQRSLQSLRDLRFCSLPSYVKIAHPAPRRRAWAFRQRAIPNPMEATSALSTAHTAHPAVRSRSYKYVIFSTR
jgi:hypothetical protein